MRRDFFFLIVSLLGWQWETDKLLPDRRPNPNWHGLLHTQSDGSLIDDGLLNSRFTDMFLFCFCFLFLSFRTRLPPQLSLCPLTCPPLSSSTTHPAPPLSDPCFPSLSCVSLHAWLAAVIPVSPSVIKGQCRNRCITGRYLTTQHFTGQALYHLSSLTAQWGKKKTRGGGDVVWGFWFGLKFWDSDTTHIKSYLHRTLSHVQ